MIGVSGSWLAKFSVGDFDDFINDAGDLIEFTVIEEAGNVLPTCAITFLSVQDGLLPLLNEGQTIKVQIGKELSDLKDIEISISKLNTVKQGDSKRLFEITGFASKIDYITDVSAEISDKKSGIEVVLETVSKSFEVDSNIRKSKDQQNWIQHSITDKKFVNNCLLHCDLGDSYPMYAITCDGRFILRDTLKYVKTKSSLVDLRFVKQEMGPKDIVYEGLATTSSNSGFLNNWLGYGRTTLAYDFETGEIKEVNVSTETLLSLSSEVDKASTISDRFNGTKGNSENVHSNFWESYQKNLHSLINLSRISVALNFTNNLIDVSPLDLCFFSEPSTESNTSSEYVSGLYLVSKVVRSIANNRVTMTVMLNREALNSINNEV